MDRFVNKLLEIIGMVIGAALAAGIPILIIVDIFRGIGGGKSIVLNCLSAVLNALGSVIMFFVGILAKIAAFFTSIGNGIAWLLSKLGVLLNPVLEVIPDSPFVPFLLFLLLGMLFLMLKRPDSTLNQATFDKFLKLTYGWCCAAFNLGIVIAGSSNPRIWMSGAFDAYVIDVPMTLFNIAQWTGFARTMLNLTLVGGVILSILFAVEKDSRYLIRSWVGLAFCCVLGYEYMNLRLAISYWLRDNLGFIGSMLTIPIGLFEFFLLIQVYLGILVFLLPLDGIKAINETTQAIDGLSTGSSSSSPAPEDSDGFPTYVSDGRGNHYPVRRDGAFIYISLPDGEISTKWEYVKGHPYFYLDGKCFYPHT